MNLQDTKVHVRRLLVEDAKSFKALRLESTLNSPSSIYSTTEEEAETSLDDFAAKLAWDSGDIVFGAFSGESLVGVTGLRREEGAKLHHTAIIWGVYVQPKFRRRGIADRLLATALEAARNFPEVSQIKLRVQTQNEAAKCAYIARGFEYRAVDQSVLCVDGRLYDEALMVLRIRD